MSRISRHFGFYCVSISTCSLFEISSVLYPDYFVIYLAHIANLNYQEYPDYFVIYLAHIAYFKYQVYCILTVIYLAQTKSRPDTVSTRSSYCCCSNLQDSPCSVSSSSSYLLHSCMLRSLQEDGTLLGSCGSIIHLKYY